MGEQDDRDAGLGEASAEAREAQYGVAAVAVGDAPPPRSIVATIGIKAAAVTAESQRALSVISRTPKASATGDMKLPTMEIERPAKSHRKPGEPSGLSDVGAL